MLLRPHSESSSDASEAQESCNQDGCKKLLGQVLIAALVGVAIIAGVKALGTSLSATFANVAGNL
jgi:hypothetical protein